MSKFKRLPDVLFVQQNEETALFNSKSGRYYGLEEVGCFIWNCLEHPKGSEEILSAILLEYDISEVECRQDLSTFINELLEEGLIVTCD